ncbi:UNVERIFIED_ORG: hypothetical protein J2806_003684 [Kosakonia oryzae]|uniref:Uncharacterized protein n=1 Tax=Kosakonia radicincitans TaxID=283686 RepID=A0AAX2EVC0_9ENTR|nr:hypothetical protein [Kosakonia oryzae]SFF08128.1 hypothetical protein SAMN03159468_03692 [Kosakonia radicincitans]SFR20716.1 hypothetical protein SAMN03159514_03400 [Kosakonia radicincitans]SFT90034.1 hypothetical protein SAMN03159428_02698 [Kosakonia radicincitans]SFX79343.1 hypothetical protein SAMN03159436_02694 [Kosakonia radicincitans]
MKLQCQPAIILNLLVMSNTYKFNFLIVTVINYKGKISKLGYFA